MIDLRKHRFFVKLFSSAILMQALLSIASLSVGLLLIRRASDVEYGFYVLITSTVLLLTALQNAYIQPSLVYCVTNPNNSQEKRSQFVGGVFHAQRTLLTWFGAVLVVVAVLLWLLQVLSHHLLLIIVAGAFATVFALYREFFRMALLAYRRPDSVLQGDLLYAVLLIGGVFLATLSPVPAATAALVLGVAALMGGRRQEKLLRAHENWDDNYERGALRRIYSVGLWAALGAGIHWMFAQGYSYLVAGTLSVSSVAAIAAIRMLVMPVNLISTGISTFMFPTVSGWLQRMLPAAVLRRLLLVALGLACFACIYLAVVWWFRDWIFASILKKNFADQNKLLLLWFLVSIAMLLRDQLGYILISRARFRPLSALTLGCAIFSLSVSYLAMLRFGEVGALYGLLLGEMANVTGLLLMSWREIKRPSEPIGHVA